MGRSLTARVTTLALVGAAGVLLAAPARGQKSYPNRPIEFIIPFPPGGPADTAARIIQPHLARALRVPIVLTTRPGGGGALAADYVAKAKPDGYTILAGTNAPLAILPTMQPDLTFRPSDFAPVGAYMTDIGVITAKAGAPWKSLDEFIEYARRHPGKLSYGSAGLGTVSFFTAELFKQAYGLDIIHVPFQGAAVKNALMGGHITLGASGLSTVLSLMKSGDLVGLVSSGRTRLAEFPDMPTMAERGFPEAALNIWMALLAPAKTPPDIVDKLWRALATTMREPAVVAAVAKSGMAIDVLDPATTAAHLEAERAAVAKVVSRLGIGGKQ